MPSGAVGEHHFACVERECIKAVNVKVHPLEEAIEVPRIDACWKQFQFAVWVDVCRHLGQDVHFGLAERGHHRARLSIEIGELEMVEV